MIPASLTFFDILAYIVSILDVNIEFLHAADRWFHLPVLPSQAAALLWRLVGFHLTATSAT